MEIEDQLSEMINRDIYFEKLNSEIQRKQAILKCVIFNQLEEKHHQKLIIFEKNKVKFSTYRKPFYEALYERRKSEFETKLRIKVNIIQNDKEKAKIREAKEVEKNKEFIKIQNKYK